MASLGTILARVGVQEVGHKLAKGLGIRPEPSHARLVAVRLDEPVLRRAERAVAVRGAAADRAEPVDVVVDPGHGRRGDAGLVRHALGRVDLLSQRVLVAADRRADLVLRLLVRHGKPFLHDEVRRRAHVEILVHGLAGFPKEDEANIG